MEGIIFYKLVSPYPEDITKDCKLSMADMDSNFLAFKNNDISAATFHEDSYVIDLTRNDGENISIDISSLRDYVDQKTSGCTSGCTPCMEDMDLELTQDGVLTLTWTVGSATTRTSVSGLVTSSLEEISADSVTIDGSGKEDNPLRLSNLEKTSAYKNVIEIVDELPLDSRPGDRYITSRSVSDHGALYTRRGVERIKEMIGQQGLQWRIPTKDDWDGLFTYVDPCEDSGYYSDEVSIEQGEYVGRILKSTRLWDESGNTDSIGFTVYPTYYADEYRSLVDDIQDAVFWTDTPYSGGTYYVKEFQVGSDKVFQKESVDEHMYSVRLVMDYDSLETGFDANIFGESYKVVNIPQLKQLWIASNLDAVLGDDDYGIEFEYDGADVNTRYYINHDNGVFWEKRQLENGDTVTVGRSEYVKEYKVFNNGSGDSSLAKSCEIRNGRVVLDSGWY